MKIRESYKYKNYNPIPQNEYSSTNMEKNKNLEDVDYDAIDEQLSLKQRVRYQSGKVRNGGWIRSGKANGWPADSARQHDELKDARRHSNDVRKNKLNFD